LDLQDQANKNKINTGHDAKRLSNPVATKHCVLKQHLVILKNGNLETGLCEMVYCFGAGSKES
jgi:hypothetical protein